MQGPFAARTRRHFGDLAYTVLETVEALAQAKGCTTSQMALAWCGQQPGVTSPIVGPRTLEHLQDNLGALAVTVTDEDRATLDEVAEPEQAVVPYYSGKMIDFKAPQHRW